MMRRHILAISLVLALAISCGCNGSGSGIVPPINDETGTKTQFQGHPDRLMLGMYEAVINVETLEAEVIPLRTTSLTININGFMNQGLNSFTITDIEASSFFTDGTLSCSCNLVHPFPGLSQYNIFDTWFVFMSNGNSHLAYDNLTYSGGPDAGQHETVVLNPDGYTRWFNWSEFFPGQWLLVTYNPGKLANLPEPTAMLNPYKIYASGLGTIGDFYEWIKAPINCDDRGVFLADSAVKSRRFYFQFPMVDNSPVVRFQYVIMCSWMEGDPSLTGDPHEYEPWDFPADANVDEPFFLHVDTSESDLYYESPGDAGGTFAADIEVFDWQGGIVSENGVPNEVYRILIEGDFIPTGSYEFSQGALAGVALPSTVVSSVFQVEISHCEPHDTGSTDLWVIVESAGENGESYDQGIVAPFPDSRRAAFMKASVTVGTTVPNEAPVINFIYDDILGTPDYKNPVDQLDPAITYDVDFTDPDGGVPTISWWVLDESETPSGPGTVSDSLVVDWLNDGYDFGNYNIWVEVDDGYNQVQEAFPITYEDAFLDKILVDNAYTGGDEDGSFLHPFSTIMAGMAAGATTGFEVWVDDSEMPYVEEVVFESGVTLRSVNWDISDGTNRAFIDGPDIAVSYSAYFLNVDNAVLDGFRIGYAYIGDLGWPFWDATEMIRIEGGSNNTIQDCLFTGLTNLTTIYAITAYGTTDLTIANCRIASIDWDTSNSGCMDIWGVYAESCPGLTLRNNVFSDIRSKSDGSHIDMNAFHIVGSSNVTANNNLVCHITPPTPDMANLWKGFYLNGCSNPELSNNTVDDIDTSDAFSINQCFAYFFDGCGTVVFTNNIATSMYSSGFPNPLARGVCAYNGDSVVCDFTDIWDIGPGSNGTYYHGDAGPGDGAINFDPEYNDPDNDDYDLSGTSPAQAGDPDITDWDDTGSGGSRMGCHGGPGGESVGLLTPQ